MHHQLTKGKIHRHNEKIGVLQLVRRVNLKTVFCYKKHNDFILESGLFQRPFLGI